MTKTTILPPASRSDMRQDAHWRANKKGLTIQELRRQQQRFGDRRMVRAALKGDLAKLLELGYKKSDALRLIALAQKA